MPNAIARAFNAIGGSLMARSGRVGILATTGAKTGKPRSAPLGYVARADGTVLVGSGRLENRGWVVNLKANPACTYKIKGTEKRYRARPLEGEEREAALAELIARVGSMGERMTWGDVFLLEPEA
ncbi:MAG TPA: nitroreductase family deazaflavin-dependent oxidoreductase [Candidatus Limnocylindrales bacterium]|nr:nitroreductase family deazaflavin-dependent oxidoreductase [Candidatus Limnocylindrales bacterium]